jgi:hypothetical protein
MKLFPKAILRTPSLQDVIVFVNTHWARGSKLSDWGFRPLKDNPVSIFGFYALTRLLAFEGAQINRQDQNENYIWEFKRKKNRSISQTSNICLSQGVIHLQATSSTSTKTKIFTFLFFPMFSRRRHNTK